ncbi:hypothetical protein DY000_02052952 [Brassica cretica]|uniref:Arabidopsis retrotransposon Orf1 C-terminal domain-containing protein n=1 Tax=Brassica cretica TaxID=69181 RepID=A0ABQ7A8Y0_BRACR|nr:hypothetical protein DY000_02052952 [Brassica cretica]
MLHAIGIAPLCYTTHELYPNLVRQVLATATITYENSNAPSYSYANCSFSFMADGEYCSLSLDKLNEIYETANEPKGVAVAKKFSPSNAFWDCIANGNFTPGKAYQSQIRKTTLRVIAKIISNLLFAKDLTSKVTNGELQTLYAGIKDEIRASGSGIPIQKVKTNPGFNLMTMICERRQCLLHGSNKKDRSGSLLTPFFKHFGIDLSKYSVNKEVQYLDIKYLMACHVMRDEETYSFFDKAGTQLFTKLPHPEITRFSVFDNISFLPPPELLCTDPRAAAPGADMEDVEDITPEVEPSYDLGELADVTDDQAYRRWMVDLQRKNNSLMRRILHLITGGCIGGSKQRQPPAEQTPRSHRPGKAPMGTGTSTEEVLVDYEMSICRQHMRCNRADSNSDPLEIHRTPCATRRLEDQLVMEAKNMIRQKECGSVWSQYGSAAEDEETVSSQDSCVTSHPRVNRDGEFDYDLEDIMVMDAIWLLVDMRARIRVNKG